MQSRTICSASAKHRSPLSMTSPPALYMVRAINGPHHHQPHGCRNHAVALPPMQNPDAELAPLAWLCAALLSRDDRIVSYYEISAPETNAYPPAPFNTITRTAGSRSKGLRSRGSASHMPSDTALHQAGLLKVIQPRLGRRSRPTCSRWDARCL